MPAMKTSKLPKNELGFIFAFINSLFKNLHVSYQDLKHKSAELYILNKTLEDKVNQRTLQLTISNKALAAMALFPEQSSSPIFRADNSGKILYANMACEQLFRFWSCNITKILPKNWSQLIHDVIAMNEPIQFEIFVDDQVLLLDFLPIQAQSYVNIYGTNITERKKIEQENRFLQQHNSITKLYNSYFFKTLLDERKNNVKEFALLLLQVNDLVAINQNLGHDVGNCLLEKVAVILKNTIPSDTLIGNLRDNIFVIAIFNYNSLNDIDDFSFHLISIFARPFLISNEELRTSINIGIAVYPADNTDTQTLLQYADMALLQARNQGVNTSQFYTKAINFQFSKSHQAYQDLHKAIIKKQLSLVFQPQLNLKTHKIVGAETLIRWHHPEKGLISPNDFIDILENSSLVFLVTEWLFETALQMQLLCRKKGLHDLRIAVNLTTKQLNQENLLAIIQQKITQYSVNPAFLEIEITERSSLTNPQKSIRLLHKLKQLGVKIAIDDFGSDYSSLKYLQQLPVDKIKIDKSFIDELSNNTNQQKIVRAIIHLAHQLNLATLAEGVETNAEIDLLCNYGCDEIQGYIIGKPMTNEEFKYFLIQK